ncbi:hypothetical protein ILUMI_09196 [Ignelater luminosus]|uniref:Uncharacterized protein n=1 Tax=Ignelater luminosus TaxID=2038154 RepID=A0A8K0D9Q5_IGNLU|nr:hypothetical protein ILUMI_09196 [Ignelater luminosus]
MDKKPTKENSKNDAALDVMGITDPVETKSRERTQKEICERFRQAVTINENKRYEICLPWKENHPNIETNKEIAQKRLLITTEKLKRQGLYEEYDQVFMKWLKEGIIEKVTVEKENLWGHYLPHRHVLKENSTTRLRPVFDASAKSKNGVSLNQCLETGPNLIELISSVLLRFREKKIGVISDIEKAVLQISITSRDLTNSPFILAAIIKLHLERIALEDYTHCKEPHQLTSVLGLTWDKKEDSLTDRKIQLIAAKSRVTPNKKMTIPRLELLAATISARLMKSILETMENNQQEVYFWNDSTTLLTWIQRESQWVTFV